VRALLLLLLNYPLSVRFNGVTEHRGLPHGLIYWTCMLGDVCMSSGFLFAAITTWNVKTALHCTCHKIIDHITVIRSS